MLGFLGFLGIFIGSFTALHLWDFLNINYPRDNPNLLFIFSAIMLIGGFGLTIGGILRDTNRRDALARILVPIIALFIGLITTVAPWIIKNTWESKATGVTISSILNGNIAHITPDYTAIHDQKALDAIQQAQEQNVISTAGTTQNEDLGRYFGYEDGINNYLKLPYNLTVQKNQ